MHAMYMNTEKPKKINLWRSSHLILYVITLHHPHIGRKEEGVIYHQAGNHRNRLMLRFTACGSLHEVS